MAVLAAYLPVLHFDFVSYDDPDYVTANPHVQAGLTWAGAAWAFRTSFAGNWFPLTWLSHMLDCSLFGLDSGGHHLTNLSIHLLTSLLWFALLERLTGARWRSALVAFLFALHPLHVESVAWIAERKDVLSALFWVLTLWCYAAYAARPRPLQYAAALCFFCLGLMTKPMLVTLPFVLLLLDRWPLRRGTRILEKLPFFAASLAASAGDFSGAPRSGRDRFRCDHSPRAAFRKFAGLLRRLHSANFVAGGSGGVLSLPGGLAAGARGDRGYRAGRHHRARASRLSQPPVPRRGMALVHRSRCCR